ncbi:ABC transporter permease [Mesorhizobium sp. YR577]|uniref:ABC transporter permease n=1 Tax=Mesorhizobium sp. YR577 TaxID=1884373 RepID=UPI0008F050F7|nr:ABC transporter permease [Mesorhizobium sp. YR577]SFU23146.1 peptide/nickel transport system permease protein [Mesorhizobium sp. YR577]
MMNKANLIAGAALTGLLLAAALIGAFWTPYDPLRLDMLDRLGAPSTAHWLGTDEFGRDVLSRLMAGATASMSIAAVTVTLAISTGTVLGMLAGTARGWTARGISAVSDALLAFPGILLALTLIVIVGAGRNGIVIALAIAYLPGVMRVVRSTVLSTREKEYVEASRVIGNSELYTMLAHILPNCLAPITVLGTSMFGWAILSESALSFLGLGVPPPAPTWGNMLASSQPFFEQALWLSLAPGFCISIALLGTNLLGDALRDHLDPRMAAL